MYEGDKAFICSTNPNRAISQSRRLMKAMHNKCMALALESGDISEAAAASTSSED
jgi:hypothetical protein